MNTTSTADCTSAENTSNFSRLLSMQENNGFASMVIDTYSALQRFHEYCISQGITEEQILGLLNFLQEEQKYFLEESCEKTQAYLKQHFGKYYERAIEKAKQTLRSVDARMEGKLIPFFEAGFGNHPLLIEMLIHIGEHLEETSFSMPSKNNNNGKMSTEDFLKKIVFKK